MAEGMGEISNLTPQTATAPRGFFDNKEDRVEPAANPFAPEKV